jgi:hypothetical protein
MAVINCEKTVVRNNIPLRECLDRAAFVESTIDFEAFKPGSDHWHLASLDIPIKFLVLKEYQTRLVNLLYTISFGNYHNVDEGDVLSVTHSERCDSDEEPLDSLDNVAVMDFNPVWFGLSTGFALGILISFIVLIIANILAIYLFARSSRKTRKTDTSD